MAVSIPPAVAVTFRALSACEGAQVSSVLAAALDVPREAIQLAAAREILDRASEHDHFELLQRLPQLPPSVTELAVGQIRVLLPALRQALLHGSEATRGPACAAIRATGLTAAVPLLLELLRMPPLPDREIIEETLADLINDLYDRSRSESGRHELRTARDELLNELASATERFHDRDVPDVIAAGILILGDPEHPAVRRTLWHGTPGVHAVMNRLLLESRHPGVLRFLTASLHERYPHPQVFAVLRERTDPEFVSGLLHGLGSTLSPLVEQNLHQFDRFAWLEPPYDQLSAVPGLLQPQIVTFVQAAHLKREQKAAVLDWLLRHGTPSAKLAATHGLSLLDAGLAQDVVRDNLNASDAAVQAWATSHLRHSALPDAYARLVERLESPLPEVQAAARRELADFNVERVLSLADEWSLEEARRAGRLLLKIAPDAAGQLRHELLHPARQKRIRTARQILRLGLQNEVADTLLTFAEDSDAMVRRTAAEVLEHVPTQRAADALLKLLYDPHPRVRETAAAALRRGHPTLTAAPA